MELVAPNNIDLDEETRALVATVHAMARRVEAAYTLPPDVVRRIKEGLLGETVYASNALEGSTLDLRETVAILRQGVSGSARKREAAEAHNLGEAVRLITSWIDAGTGCHQSGRLCEIHGILLRDIDDQWAGRYRATRVMIRGAVHQPPRENEVAALVEQTMAASAPAGTDTDPIVLAAWAHWAIARIHPFVDGNGRMARLWQDLILVQGGLVGGVIRPEHRPEYLEALAAADEGEFTPLVSLVAQRVAATLARYEAASLRPARVCTDRAAVKAWLDAERAQGKTIVFACGCFELLHVGHVRYLNGAREEGDVLVLAVNTDESIARIKPGRRPVNPDHERFELLAALRAVDVVIPLPESTPVELIRYLKPEVHTKGTDYTPEMIPEREVVESYGGRVAIVGDPKEHSTTEMLRAIRDENENEPDPAEA